jgi:hypothetical protein
MRLQHYVAMGLTGAVLACLGAAPPSGGGGSNNTRPQLYVTTPGYANPRDAVNADVLLDRIVFPDGVTVMHGDFVFPGQVLQMTYGGPIDRFRIQNGALATVGQPGIAYIEDLDGNGSSVSDSDRLLFAERMELAWSNRNLNNRTMLHAQSGYSFVVGLETRIWDSSFASDNRPEIFIFEDQGNSVMTLQALDDDLVPVGTPVEIRAVDITSIQPNKVWVGRWGNDGQPQSGTYECKVASIDLSRLGVTHVKWLKVTTAVSGGGEASADLKIICVDTSPAPAAQTMTFD